MALDEVLRDSLINLRPGVLDNEAQVKLTVIQPVLNELGWRATNPAEFKSEFPVEFNGLDRDLRDTAVVSVALRQRLGQALPDLLRKGFLYGGRLPGRV